VACAKQGATRVLRRYEVQDVVSNSQAPRLWCTLDTFYESVCGLWMGCSRGFIEIGQRKTGSSVTVYSRHHLVPTAVGAHAWLEETQLPRGKFIKTRRGGRGEMFVLNMLCDCDE